MFRSATMLISLILEVICDATSETDDVIYLQTCPNKMYVAHTICNHTRRSQVWLSPNCRSELAHLHCSIRWSVTPFIEITGQRFSDWHARRRRPRGSVETSGLTQPSKLT
uniref:Secreted protein n=1 Tax=Parascaris equorum TaxID=6256 RepID=A0A914SBX3_PAREQ